MEKLELQCGPESISHREVLKTLADKLKPVILRELAKHYNPDFQTDEKISLGKEYVLIARHILDTARKNAWNIRVQDGFLYIYNCSHWVVVIKEELTYFLKMCAVKMGIDPIKADIPDYGSSLTLTFRGICYEPVEDILNKSILINFKSRTMEIRKYLGGPQVLTPTHLLDPNGEIIITEPRCQSHEDFLKYALPFDYDPNAKCPKWDKYLKEVQPNTEARNLLAEYLGWIFIPHGMYKFEKILFNYGGGKNGKSVFADVITEIYRPENICSYTLAELADEKGYHRAMIPNFLLNLSTDIGSKGIQFEVFKKIASGEPLSARPIGKEPIIIRQYAKFIFNCNKLPEETEDTDGYRRRFLIVPWDQVIKAEDRDYHLAEKIIYDELPGVFNWIIEGLKRVIKQDAFTRYQGAEDASRAFELESDSVALFLQDGGYKPEKKSLDDSKNKAHFVRQSVLHEAYKTFCFNNEIKALGLIKFGNALEKKGYIKTTEGANVYGFLRSIPGAVAEKPEPLPF